MLTINKDKAFKERQQDIQSSRSHKLRAPLNIDYLNRLLLTITQER